MRGDEMTMTFPGNSRYYNIKTATFETRDGRTYAYLLRRFVPLPERFSTLQEHVVVQGDRLDNITARYLGDPLQFWRVCDANRAMNPLELTEQVGGTLVVPVPQVPGGTRP